MTMSIQNNSTKILHFLNSKGTGYYCRGQEIESNTGLTPDEINDAIKILESNGYVELSKVLGGTPYRFFEAAVTVYGKLELEERQNNQSDNKNDALKRNIFSLWKQVRKWIFGILGMVIAGIIVWWFTEGRNVSDNSENQKEVAPVIDSTVSIAKKDSIVQHNPSVDDTSLFKNDTITKQKKQKDATKKSSTPKSRNLSQKELSLIEGEASWDMNSMFHIELYNGLKNHEISDITIKIIYDKEVKDSSEEEKHGNEKIERFFRETLDNPIPPLSARSFSIKIPGKKYSYVFPKRKEYNPSPKKDHYYPPAPEPPPELRDNDYTWFIYSAKGRYCPE